MNLNKHRITDIFFDLDHTLWDFDKNSELSFRQIFEKNNLLPFLDDFLGVYPDVNQNYWKMYREGKITESELRLNRFVESFEMLNQKISEKTIKQIAFEYLEVLPTFNNLCHGAEEMLLYLSKNYKLHIITNGFLEVQHKKMAGANLTGYFEVIVTSEDAGVKKPDPAIFELAMGQANCLKENALMIGDNLEADVLGAINTGMAALHYDNSSVQTKGIPTISSLFKIKELL